MIRISGIAEVNAAIRRVSDALHSGGEMPRAVEWMTLAALRGVKARTDVDTGAYRAGQTSEMQNALTGRVFIDPAARNPRSRVPVVVYGPIEEARGGQHAAYQRTYSEQGSAIVNEAGNMLVRAFP